MHEELLASRTATHACPTLGITQVSRPSIVRNLRDLIEGGHQFKTVLADPPWRYDNTASRAAAENHYSTMRVEEICGEPGARIIGENAHLAGFLQSTGRSFTP